MDDAAATRLGALADELAEIFEVALAVEPAGELPAAWREMLDRHAVMPLGEARRSNLAAAAGHPRGAPIAEVEGCVRAALARFVAAAVAAGATREPLELAAARLWREAEARYEAYAAYRRGVVFHAAAGAGRERPAGGYVARCATCDGPRFDEGRACAFCGAAAGDLTPPPG